MINTITIREESINSKYFYCFPSVCSIEVSREGWDLIPDDFPIEEIHSKMIARFHGLQITTDTLFQMDSFLLSILRNR